MPKPQRIELPADLTTQFEVPAEATIADIDAMIAQLRKDADKMLGEKDTNVEGATWLLDAADALNGRKGELVQAETERQAQIEAARARLGKDGADDSADDDSSDDESDDDHRDGDEPGGNGGGGQSAVGDAADASSGGAPAEPVLVASAGVQRRRSAIAAAAKAQGSKVSPLLLAPTKTREASLVAAADLPGFTAGAKIDWEGVGKAALRRFESLPVGMDGGARSVLPIASVRIPSDDALVAAAARSDGFRNVDEQIAWALSAERLRRELGMDANAAMVSLLAAGGWCAPSETLYDLLNLSTNDGLINVPGITVNRGGVRYSLGPDFRTVYNIGANFTRTEAQTIAGTAKPVVNIPCPTFADHRMLVDGLYLTGDILSAKGYPEAYSDFTTKAMNAFEHYVNAATIADMVSLCTAVDMRQAASTPAFYENPSASTELLGAVELQITDAKYAGRLSLAQGVEVVLPYFAKGIIRSDLAKRAAIADPGTITDAMIDQWFSLRGANVQWVLDWQDAFTGVAAGFGAATPILAWPGQVSFMVYPQGTFVRALSDVIELNAVYDSVLLTTNQYVALFMEQARLVLKRGWDARVVTVRVPVTGATGAAFDYTTKQPNA